MGKNTDDVFPTSKADSTGQHSNDFSAGVNAQKRAGIIHIHIIAAQTFPFSCPRLFPTAPAPVALIIFTESSRG